MNRQIRLLGAAMLALFVALFLQLNYLQVVRAGQLNHDPRNSRLATKQFSRARGDLVSADGSVLAHSVRSGDPFVWQRQYPEGDLFSQVAGYFSFTYGEEGAERQFDADLTGANAPLRLQHLRDLLVKRDPTQTVTLTLRKRVQQAARTALGNRRGAVVALDPATGAVLALWSWPTFDPTPLAAHDQLAVRTAWQADNTNPNHPLLPRAYRERYPPGSTFKIVTSAAVLDRSPDLATKAYPSLTSLPLPQTNHQSLANFGGERCGGTLPDLLRVSCNTGFAQIGLDLGGAKLSGEAAAFGFGSRPPLDLPATAASTFPGASAFNHDLPALAKSAIGQQDVFATPLEMALVAAAIGNGGVIMKPHIEADVRDTEGRVVRTVTPAPWMTATSPSTASAVRDLMLGVVTGGTGTAAQIPNVAVAGKTGTAQTGTGRVDAWFAAFAPADHPKVAVAVLVEDQPAANESTGGTIAAPIARAVMAAALSGP